MNRRVHGWQPLSHILAHDEEALSAGDPLVQVYRCERVCGTVGVSQSSAVERELTGRFPGVEILRRPSGGSGLWHQPGDVFWSVVLPRSGSWVGRDFIHRYSYFGGGWVAFLAGKGLQAHWERPPARFPAYCLLSGRGEVLMTKGRILGGASQHLTSKALLHHGTISVSVDRGSIHRAFGAPGELTQEHLTSLHEEGTGLEDGELSTLADCLASALPTSGTP